MSSEYAAISDGPLAKPALALSYGKVELRRDLLAGLTVAAISLPQAMAYALIAGVDPRFGLYSAIVVTAVASIFGSSSHLINGPTNAISLVVFGALAFFDPEARLDAYQAMFLLAIMVGTIQILIAVFKLGDLTRYISEAVVLGFMAGAGSLVALGQVSNLLGMPDKGTGHQIVIERLWLTLSSGAHPNPRALSIGLGTVLLVVVLRRVLSRYRLPKVDMLCALIVATVVASQLGWTAPGPDGKPLMAVIGNVPAGFPRPHVPEVKFWWLREMSGSALAIAVLGLLEALAISKSIASSTRQVLDYNRQCLAEGLANLVGGFFQCLPGSGSLTRSAINHQAGAATRVSGLFTAAAVALVVAVAAPLARFIPKAALAGLLVVTAVRLIDRPRTLYALRASRYDAGLVLVTALVAVFLSVEFSILIGVALSIVLFVPRAARLKAFELTVTEEHVIRRRRPLDRVCNLVVIYDLEGELFFGAAPEFDHHLTLLQARAKAGARVLILRLRRIRNPDLVCMERLEHFLREMQREQVLVLLTGIGPDLAQALKNLRFEGWFPKERMFHVVADAPGSSTIEAVRYAYRQLGASERARCRHCEPLQPLSSELYYMV